MGLVTILPETTRNPITLIGQRAGICQGSDISNSKKNYKRGYECITSEHGRLLEYPRVDLLLEHYSARVIREWYTHVGGSPTRLQASTRYINYAKGEGFPYVVPHTIESNEEAFFLYQRLMSDINDTIRLLEEEYEIPREDASVCLPLSMETRIVDSRNLRNLVDMSRQRMCSRAYWEYRELFEDISVALKNYSEEWNTVVSLLFKAKCEITKHCPEKKGCGRYPSNR